MGVKTNKDGGLLLKEAVSNSVPNFKVLRGEIWMADLGNSNRMGSEQRGYRPVLVIQNDTGNKFSTTVIVASITKQDKTNIPTHMDFEVFEPSTIMFEQINTISKLRLSKKLTMLSDDEMIEAENRIKISLGLM